MTPSAFGKLVMCTPMISFREQCSRTNGVVDAFWTQLSHLGFVSLSTPVSHHIDASRGVSGVDTNLVKKEAEVTEGLVRLATVRGLRIVVHVLSLSTS